MSQCEAMIRDEERQWHRCPSPAQESLVVSGMLFEYCTPHVEQFILWLPAHSWEREAAL